MPLAPPFVGRSPWKSLRRSLRSYYYAERYQSALRELDAYCMFIGHARAGGSLVGALLDAHPEAVIADEIDVLGLMQLGWSRDRILASLIPSSRTQARWRHTPPGTGRTLPNPVSGQWQGRFVRLSVTGSSRAGLTTRAVADQPSLLDAWRSILGPVSLRAIHVVRSPYDAISQMILRSGRGFDSGIERYFSNCQAVTRVRSLLAPDEVLLVRYETLVDDPRGWLRRCCAHLGLVPSDEYLEATASLVRPRTPHRLELPWSPAHVADVARQSERFDFLAGYDFAHQAEVESAV